MIILVLLIVGLAFGSFINALVWRVHEQARYKDIKAKNNAAKEQVERLSISKGRSMCPNCKHELAVKDLIPIFSWLYLRGRCRYCQKPIPDSPLIEALLPLLFITSYILWPVSLNGIQIAVFVLWLVLLIGLVALALYDLKWYLLPNRIMYSLSYIAVAIAILGIIGSSNHLTAVVDTILAIAISGGIFYALFQVSKGKWIGGGDVRLGFLLGFVMGTPGKSVLLLFLASLIGTLLSIPLLFANKLKRSSIIPFGPFLIIAAIIAQLGGHSILTWYQNLFFSNGV